MMQKQDMHQHPKYSLTTSMYISEIVFRLVCWCEQVYRAVSNRIDANDLRQRGKRTLDVIEWILIGKRPD